jgi:RimJ/RimL family protein N-acetyltransferase
VDLHLRDVEDEDLPIFFEHQRDSEATRMAAFIARGRDAFMTHWKEILGDETIAKKTIVSDGRVDGNIVSFDRNGEREIGYWVGREHWGKGVATRALSAFLAEVSARPLHARVAKHNLGSIRVLEKCGFTITRQEKGHPDANGREVEEVILELNETR